MKKIEAIIRPTKVEDVKNALEKADEVVNVIQENAHTGNFGDGKIFVIAVEKIVRIRTGEVGGEAI